MKQRDGIVLVSVLAIGGLAYWQRDTIKTFFVSTPKPTGKAFGKLTDQVKINFARAYYPSAKVIGNQIGVPPLFILSQLALESKYGQSELTSKYFNFGGIKAVKGQKSVSMLTTECKNGICKKVYQDFAVFPNAVEGLKAQSKIYQNKYFKQHLNKTKDPYEYAKLIQSGKIKYATALSYPKAIESTINEFKRLKVA